MNSDECKHKNNEDALWLVTRLRICLTAKVLDTGTLFAHCGSYQQYRSGTVNSKSFVGKVLLRIKQKFELN